MLADIDIERFSIDKFIADCLKLDKFEIHLRCQNIVIWLETITFPSKDADYLKKERSRRLFIRFLNQLCFILTQNKLVMQPPRMSDEVFFKIKPVLEKLVKDGDLKKEWLTLYEHIA